MRVLRLFPLLQYVIISKRRNIWTKSNDGTSESALDRVKMNRYLSQHERYSGCFPAISRSLFHRYYAREVRARVYKQFLQPYQSVTLKSVAEAFRVSEAFIDNELATFIASSRLHCKIDKVWIVQRCNTRRYWIAYADVA